MSLEIFVNVHVVEFGPGGWAIQHPALCRPDLLGCPTHKAVTEDMARYDDGPPWEFGRYTTTLSSDGKPMYLRDESVQLGADEGSVEAPAIDAPSSPPKGDSFGPSLGSGGYQRFRRWKTDENTPPSLPDGSTESDFYAGHPTRERCENCREISAVGFFVSNEVWQAAVHPSLQNSVLCLRCFVDRADARMVQWDDEIELFPVSLVTHLKNCGWQRIHPTQPWGPIVRKPRRWP